MKRDWQVIIIGAGPSGSQVAYRLAQKGYRIAVFEAKEAIGSKLCCTGIVSRECFERFSPDASTLLNKASSAKFFVPSGRYLRLEKDTVQAYIIDRATFDMALAKRAKEAGTEYFLGNRVTDLLVSRSNCQVGVDNHGQKEVFQAKAVVIASGFRSTFPQRLGMGKITNFVLGAQSEVNTELTEVEIYFDVKLAPGGFGWLVPTGNGRGLAGVMSRHDAYSAVTRLLSKLSAEGKISSDSFQIRQKAIPLGCLPRSYGDRVVVVGEAAGQVKPTTGGGIYFGLLGANAAADILHHGFLLGDLSSRQLSRYQKRWRAELGTDISLGLWVRMIYERLRPGQMERIFDAIASGKIHEQLLEQGTFSFDRHSVIISELFRRPKLLAVLLTSRLLFSTAGVQALFQLICRNRRKDN